jgi:Arc/MetJ-type ribon-helix-helix transcriptional regulator
MAKAISVRLDDEAERALRALEATGLTQSDAIRSALLTSAERLRRGRELAAEAAEVWEAHSSDRIHEPEETRQDRHQHRHLQ